MEIGPIKNGGQMPGEPLAQRNQEETVETSVNRDDSVRISDEARSRYDQIRERIESGYYEQADIIEETVDKLIDKMLNNISEFYK